MILFYLMNEMHLLLTWVTSNEGVAWLVITTALTFLSYYPHQYFKDNPNVREMSQFGLLVFLAMTLPLFIGIPCNPVKFKV